MNWTERTSLCFMRPAVQPSFPVLGTESVRKASRQRQCVISMGLLAPLTQHTQSGRTPQAIPGLTLSSQVRAAGLKKGLGSPLQGTWLCLAAAGTTSYGLIHGHAG